ncbi:MAG: ribonuclease HI family protein [bacterium]|nr:ribonuclease HI family protein [bacterium]
MVVSPKRITIFSDGGARGNPGPAAAGVFLEIPAEKLRLLCGKYLGINTNNYAEYQGVILGLKQALNFAEPGRAQVEFFLDSNLVVQQLNGLFKIKAPNLGPLVEQIRELEGKFTQVSYTHVPREKNYQADRAVNLTLDSRQDFSKEIE